MTDSEYEFLGDSKPKRRGWLKAIVWVMIVVLAGTFAVGAGSYFFITNQLSASGIEVYATDGNSFDLPTPEDIDGPINVLLVGSDTREGQGSTAYGPVGSALADVIILLHISRDRQNAVAMSIPRDLMVAVPSCPNPEGGDPYPARDFAQINSTMTKAGPACTLLAVQQLTGVTIPYLAVIDFKGVIAMSEAIGGVDVCVATAIDDEYTNLYLEPGEHTLIGDEALAFLRTRHGVGDGSDLSRISNQQVFLTSMVRKLKDEGALTNPFTMFRLGTAALSNMTLSKSLTDLGVIFGLAQQVNQVDLDKITFIKLPVYDLDGEYAGRVAPSPERAAELFELMASDKPLVLAEANPGSGAVVAEDSPVVDATLESTDPAAAAGEVAVLPEWVQGTNAATKSCSN
ncbi:MAG: LCP family protein [Micrococcales bacterium]|nr:LCP family protein [Micrococcales bacterium]